MRSKIGIKSRLAAHIMALILLIIMLVYLAPSAGTRADRQPVTPAATPIVQPATSAVPVEPVPPPVEALPPPVNPVPETTPEPVAIIPDPIAPEELVEADNVAEATPEDAETTAEAEIDLPPAEQIGETPEEETPLSDDATADGEIDPDPAEGEDVPASAQPDESGSLVVAAPDAGADQPASAPLPHANLEVLGDEVYWLASRYDLDRELEAVPEIAGLILLAPLPTYATPEFEDVDITVIPADVEDLDFDAAERFIHLTAGAHGPVVVAALPGARGAAFFKGAYLLRNRKLSHEDVVREIAAELEEAGPAREEIIHRLLRLNDQ